MMKTTETPSTYPNHSGPHPIDYAFGTNFGTRFVIDNCVDAVIDFANGNVQPLPRLVDVGKLANKTRAGNKFSAEEFPAWSEEQEENVLFFSARGGGLVDRATALAEFAAEVRAEREYAIGALKAASDGIGPLVQLLKTFHENIETEVDIALYPLLIYDQSGRPKLGWGVSGSHDRTTWVKFAALVIADRASGKLTDVGRCQLDSCGRFFRIERNGPGKPSRKYCPGTDHMERAHALASTARSQKKRRRDAAGRMKKRRRAPAAKK
jgi:hypothetical protein